VSFVSRVFLSTPFRNLPPSLPIGKYSGNEELASAPPVEQQNMYYEPLVSSLRGIVVRAPPSDFLWVRLANIPVVP